MNKEYTLLNAHVKCMDTKPQRSATPEEYEPECTMDQANRRLDQQTVNVHEGHSLQMMLVHERVDVRDDRVPNADSSHAEDGQS